MYGMKSKKGYESIWRDKMEEEINGWFDQISLELIEGKDYLEIIGVKHGRRT